MKIPYHGLQACGNVLLAARGCSIHTFSLRDGTRLSTWTCPSKSEESEATPGQENGEAHAEQDGEPGHAAKRRRVEKSEEVDQEEEGEEEGGEEEEEEARGKELGEKEAPAGQTKRSKKSSKKRGRKRRSRPAPTPRPAEQPTIQCLTPTADGRYVVAVTGLDKTIWVLEHDGAGRLRELSQRPMPKRPSSIALTLDEKTILSADKFGDVFSLPLIPDGGPGGQASPPSAPSAPSPAAPGTPSSAPHAFRPQANALTVHTKRNLRALENQRVQAQQARTRTAPEHELLLGHVSMLTAVVVASQRVEDDKNGGGGRTREYIITGDRDEHIRVSRGPASGQAHVIESFCLGHEQFVSRLCVPPSRPEILVSGGGDDVLFVWDWLHGRLLSTADLLAHVQSVRPAADTTAAATSPQLAVSTLRAFHHPRPDGDEPGTTGTTWLVAACEAVPALFFFRLRGGALQHAQTLHLPGNLLDAVPVAGETDEPHLMVAVDNSGIISESNEQDEGRDLSSFPSLTRLAWDGGESRWQETPFRVWDEALGDGEADITAEELKKSLYTTEALRKMDYDDD